MRLPSQIVLVSIVAGLAFAQSPAPERQAQGNVIVSDHDPKVRIELPEPVRYVGADRWALYGIADCELHAFVESGAHGNVRKLYWIQFEGYMPSKPDLHHTYDSPRHVTRGGMDFYVDTWVRGRDEPITPGSDRERIEHLIRASGYRMSAGMMYVRLVHLLDPAKRKELMVIYGEDLGPFGPTPANLQKGGKAYDKRPSLEKDLIKSGSRERQDLAIKRCSTWNILHHGVTETQKSHVSCWLKVRRMHWGRCQYVPHGTS